MDGGEAMILMHPKFLSYNKLLLKKWKKKKSELTIDQKKKKYTECTNMERHRELTLEINAVFQMTMEQFWISNLLYKVFFPGGVCGGEDWVWDQNGPKILTI